VPARSLDYDSLVIAVGSTTNDFNTQGAADHCLFLDTRQQAEKFHQQLLNHYLRAHAGQTDITEEITVAIVGAGATGVELAAELHNAAHELAAYGLGRIKPENLRITLIEAGPRVLPALPERIGGPVHTTLEKLGVTVLTNAAVSEVTADSLITASGQVIPATLKVWAAGIRAPVFLHELDGLESNRINQLQVRTTLQTTRDDNVFAFGDCAACPQKGSDRNVPPRAQAAHQQASLLVKSLRLRIEGKPLPAYKYTDYGSLISLSKFSAVGNLMGNLMGSVMLEGWLARMFYISLYRMHQMALYGTFRTLMLMLGSRIGKGTEPRMKLH
jgi:NADH dehydrogenase